ncbi:hypothetical protein A3K88_21705 [Pseudomonas putida]|nr:hypothetical protein A3K88_21705 [Pseudomonas putida]
MKKSEKPNICSKCHRIHSPATSSIAVGRFRPDGPTGYVAREVAGAPLRDTREQATADFCHHWQPIASAPLDGTEVLLASVGQTFDGVPIPDRVTMGHYTVGDELLKHVGDCGGVCRCPEYEDIEPFWMSWDGGFTDENPPTHWMPLPAPPTE